jgi:arylformamidase
MERATATDLFRIRDHVPDFDGIVEEIRERSRRTRSVLRCHLNVAFGSGSSDRIDLFFPDTAASDRPVHLFIHGGYWRMFTKEDYSYVADTVTNAGAIAAIMDYTLMPAVRMETLILQVRAAKNWLQDKAESFGGMASRLTVSGHSAGAHLATFLLEDTDPRIQTNRTLLLGGIYDLKPLQKSFLQAEISLTDDEVERYSPLNRSLSKQSDVTVLVGEKETLPFHQQAKAFASHLAMNGSRSTFHQLAGADHMTSVRDLGKPGTEASYILEGFVNDPISNQL